MGNTDNIYSVDEDNHFMVDHKFLLSPTKILFLQIDYLKRIIFVDGAMRLCIIVSKKYLLLGQTYPDTYIVRLDTLQLENLIESNFRFDSELRKKDFFICGTKEN